MTIMLPAFKMPTVTPSLQTSRALADEIKDGTLILRADALARYRFALAIGEQPVGVFCVCSDGAGKLTMVRAWNSGTYTRDPFSGLEAPCSGRQFYKATTGSPVLFLVEYSQLWVPLGRVAFKAGSADSYDCSLGTKTTRDLKFEALDLRDLVILG